MSQNLHNQVVRLLVARGRWIRAGRDNIVAYLSVQLECGPGQLDVIRQTLLAGEAPLHVEQSCGRIVRIGLSDWVGNDAILVEEVPGDVEAAWLRIAELERQTNSLQADRADAEAALQLGQEAEMQLADCERQLAEALATLQATQRQLCETTSADDETVAALRKQLESQASVLRTRTAALRAANDRKADLEDENRRLRARLAKLKPLEPLLETPMVSELLFRLTEGLQRTPPIMVLEVGRL